jgi:Cu/Ag efflux pump CusA
MVGLRIEKMKLQCKRNIIIIITGSWSSGLLSSAFLTLVLIPALYEWFAPKLEKEEGINSN